MSYYIVIKVQRTSPASVNKGDGPTKIYEDLEEAQQEAERLAGLYNGDFFVFKALGFALRANPPVEWRELKETT